MSPNRTVAVDMRGYGDSDKPGALEDYKMPHLVNDVKEIIEALGRYTDPVRVRTKTLTNTKETSLQSVRHCALLISCVI